MSSFRSFHALRTVARAARPMSTSARVARILPSTSGSFSRLSTQKTFSRAFSVSSRAFAQTAADNDLSARLESEIKHELEAAADEAETPDFVKEFTKSGIWTVDQRPGQDEVFITRKYKDETVRVMFTISDVENEPLFDEEAEGEDGEMSGVFPIRCSITITKPTGGALTVEALAQDGIFSIETVSYYKDANLATDLSAEGDFTRRGKYLGPQFEHLDVSVQEGFEAWLAERGVGEELSTFIPEYAEWKEQKEYVSWLKDVKNFVSA